MDELDLRHNLHEVQAPPGFERMVLARLHEVKSGARPLRDRTIRPKFAWAGGLAAALLVCLVIVNLFFLPKNTGVSTASLGSGTAQSQAVPVMDSVDYGREVRSISGDPSTIYILEQVSDSGTSGNIRY